MQSSEISAVRIQGEQSAVAGRAAVRCCPVQSPTRENQSPQRMCPVVIGQDDTSGGIESMQYCKAGSIGAKGKDCAIPRSPTVKCCPIKALIGHGETAVRIGSVDVGNVIRVGARGRRKLVEGCKTSAIALDSEHCSGV